MGLRSHLGIPGHGSGRRHGRPYLLGDKVFKLEFKTDSAAFLDDPMTEPANVLRRVALRIDYGETSGIVRDSNGNTIGSFELTED